MNPEQPGIARKEPGNARNESGTNAEKPEPPQRAPQDPPSEISSPQSEAPDPKSPIPDPKSEDFREAAADLPFRLKRRGRFDQLTSEQQNAIMALLETYNYITVLEVIAQRPPLGMSFKVGKSALFEFKARYRKLQADPTQEGLNESSPRTPR